MKTIYTFSSDALKFQINSGIKNNHVVFQVLENNGIYVSSPMRVRSEFGLTLDLYNELLSLKPKEEKTLNEWTLRHKGTWLEIECNLLKFFECLPLEAEFIIP